MTELRPRPAALGAACFVDFDSFYDGMLATSLHDERDHKKALESCLGVFGTLRTRLREEGTPMVLGRAYSLFDESPGSDAAHPLALLGYEPQFVIHHKKWNSADLQLAIDLVEVQHTRPDIERFVIFGGDQDFLPIARKVLEARRELLIVAPAAITSGDLIDRIGGARFLDAATLVADAQASDAPGVEVSAPSAADDAAHHAGETDTKPQARGARILGQVDLSTRGAWSPLSDSAAISDERQHKCLQLILGLSERFRANGQAQEVWLSPFLKREMAEHFAELTHPQRRKLVNLLKEQGKISIQERESQTGPYPYSVIVLNMEHPAVGEMRV